MGRWLVEISRDSRSMEAERKVFPENKFNYEEY
jgi:hypothetical protein